MIDFIRQTPKEFSKQSRDYQLLSRLFSLALNVSKMYIDDMNVWNRDIDNKLVALRAKTLNFNTTYNWNLDDMESVTDCFKYLISNKGTKNTIEYFMSLLMRIKNIPAVNDKFENDSIIDIDTKKCIIKLFINDYEYTSVGILEDLIKYILPAGYTYRICYIPTLKVEESLHTDVYYIGDNLSPDPISNGEISEQSDDIRDIKHTVYYGEYDIYKDIIDKESEETKNNKLLSTIVVHDSEGNLIGKE